jgi:predicted metal-dependent enzyme (double-stranded beta helix superfamily)
MISKETRRYRRAMDIHPALRGAAWARSLPAGGLPVDDEVLAAVVSELAVRPDLWRGLARHDRLVRWYERVALTGTVEVWLIGWWPGQHTPLHDHGGASGALAVVGGVLEETLVRPSRPARTRRLPAGTLLRMPPSTIHRVGNAHALPATSIHAYSPPGLEMNAYASAVPVPVPVPALAMAA